MPGGGNLGKKKDDKKKEKPKYEPPVEAKFGKKRRKGPDTAVKLPNVYPSTRCKLKLLKLERIKDHLLLEEEFIANQEALQPTEARQAEEREKIDELRGYPMSIGTLEEIIDDDHAIVSSTAGSEYYVTIMSFVDKGLLEPG
ncbi:hypothetical protein OXX79_000910, partial [Metschnikowia pulcherrima]